MLLLPASAEIVEGFVAAAEAAPEELSGIGNAGRPADAVPARGGPRQAGHAGAACYAGDAAAAEQALALFRPWPNRSPTCSSRCGTPMFMAEEEEYHPTAVSRTMFVDTVDRAVAGTVMRQVAPGVPTRRCGSPSAGSSAAQWPAADATARPPRSRIMVNVAAFYEGPATTAPSARPGSTTSPPPSTRTTRRRLRQLLADEGPARSATPTGPTWDRLVEVKRRYDPDNLFHRNQNILPA